MTDQDTTTRVAVLERALKDHLIVCTKDKETHAALHKDIVDTMKSMSNRIWLLLVATVGALATFISTNWSSFTP